MLLLIFVTLLQQQEAKNLADFHVGMEFFSIVAEASKRIFCNGLVICAFGRRFVAVKNRLLDSKGWLLFHDFLGDYIKMERQ